MTATTPTVCKLQLGKLLTALREQAGLTQDQAARLIRRKDRNKINLLEKAQGSITPVELEVLLNGYGADEDELRELLHRLRDGSSQRGRWTGYRAVYGDPFRRFIDFEEDAELIRVAEVEIIPGLLQTEAYARALYTNQHSRSDFPVEHRVQARLARQKVLFKPDAPELRFVLSESCLRRKWGNSTVMHEQLTHLIGCSERENVIIQVLPFELPDPSQQQTWFNYRVTLLRIPAPGLAGPLEVAYSETGTDYQFDDDKASLAAHDKVWARLSDAALDTRESRAFLRSVADSYR
jgi:transcriptional regulator with XRE-family HTH domain